MRSRFLADIVQLGSGTALAQGVTILSVPVLSRIFVPESFGIAALFGSLMIILSTISGLRYELAVLLPEDDSDGFDLLLLQIGLAVVIGTITGFLLWVGRHHISQWLNAPELEQYLWFVGPAAVVLSLLNGLSYWNTRRKRFAFLASTKLANSIVTAVTQLLAGILGSATAGGLIGGNVFGKAFEDGVQGWRVISDSRRNGLRSSGLRNLYALAKRYRKFPIYTTWSALVNAFSWQVAPFLLAVFFIPTIVGFYTVGERVIRTPMNMLGRAISQVFFQRGAEAHRQGNLREVFLNTTQMLSRIGLLPTLVLTIAGREIFIVILGFQWAEAGVYVQILGVWAFIWFLSSPTSIIMTIVEKQEKALLFNMLNLITRIGSLLIGGFLARPRLALMLFSISGITTYGWLLIWVGQTAGVPWRRTLREIISADFYWVIVVVPVLVGLQIASLPDFWIVALAAIILSGYYGYLIKRYMYLFKK